MWIGIIIWRSIFVGDYDSFLLIYLFISNNFKDSNRYSIIENFILRSYF